MLSEPYRSESKLIRRQLHQIPEIGCSEYKTQNYILTYLQGLGFQPEKCADTGVICYIDYGKSETIAIRSDIDGLPITENLSHSYVSTHVGSMHACGHDAHMSMLLTTAIALHDHIIEPRSNVLLIFQPAEEGPGGAQRMVQEGILSRFNVSAIYGYHLHPEYPFGSIASRAGAFFANCVEIYFNVKGKSSHGAQPQNGRDALLAVANLVTQISALSAKTNSPFEDSVIMLGRLSAGDRLNIVAEHAILEGSIRTYSIEARDKLIKRLFDISEGISKSFEVDVTFKPVYFYPALFNSEALYNDAKEKLTDLIHAEKVMLSEDFSYYADEIPALFMLLGIDDANPAHQNSLHSSSFDFDEEVLLYGVDGYLKLLV